MTTFIYAWKVQIDKALKLFFLLFAFHLLTACAQMTTSMDNSRGIPSDNHMALVRYYEDMAKEAKLRLKENLEILQEYDAHPYFYGRQGLDVQSHTKANVRAYEKVIQESLTSANLHRKLVIEQTQKARLSKDTDLTSKISDSNYSDN